MNQKLSVIFENEFMIAVNKPAGLLSIPDRFIQDKPNVYNSLKRIYPDLLVVHRIDKDTSGVLLFAKEKEVHKELNILFENHKVAKNYLCITESFPQEQEGIIDEPIAHSTSQTGKMVVHLKGKESITKYSLLEKFKNFSLILAQPITGRTHQIRVHLAHIGCPLVCDPLYGTRTEISISDIKSKMRFQDQQEIRPLLQRTALHSWKMIFSMDNTEYTLEAEMPKDMKALIAQLKKWASIR